jgi:hypothetical protein
LLSGQDIDADDRIRVFGGNVTVTVSRGKVLAIGLGDLVTSRNAALRKAGFDVVAATCLEEVAQQCSSVRFDAAVVGSIFSIQEKAIFVRCIQGVFRLPVVLITDGPYVASITADRHVRVDAPADELVTAIIQLVSGSMPGLRSVPLGA